MAEFTAPDITVINYPSQRTIFCTKDKTKEIARAYEVREDFCTNTALPIDQLRK